MVWIIFLYVLTSIAVAASATIRVSVWTGVSIVLASALALIGSGGIKAGFLWYEKNLRLPRLVIGVVLLAGALWLSRYFSVGLFGHSVTGLEWTILGILIGILCIGRSLAV